MALRISILSNIYYRCVFVPSSLNFRTMQRRLKRLYRIIHFNHLIEFNLLLAMGWKSTFVAAAVVVAPLTMDEFGLIYHKI